jgi:pimeloyl-ACP methyl ester carboxylesterase
MYFWLGRIGYRPFLSRIGRNAECLDVLVGRLLGTVEEARASTGRAVHLIGHSLGGMLARSATVRRPDRIASVITLGSPFRGIRSHPLVMQAASTVRARIRSRAEQRDDRLNCFTAACQCDTVKALQAPLPSPLSDVISKSRSRPCGARGSLHTAGEKPGTDHAERLRTLPKGRGAELPRLIQDMYFRDLAIAQDPSLTNRSISAIWWRQRAVAA